MEEKCIPDIKVIQKPRYNNPQMGSTIEDADIRNKNTIFKDDDSGSGSSEDVLGGQMDSESNEVKSLNLNRDHENVGIYLETPVIDENNICLNSHDYEKAKPKRLSDEFLSSDDNDDDTTTEPVPSQATSSIKKTGNSFPISAKSGITFAVDEDPDSNGIDLSIGSTQYQAQSAPTDNNTNSDKLKDKKNFPSTASSSSVATANFGTDVQSMDAIERRDFEHEQRLTGGHIIKSSAMAHADGKLKLSFLKKIHDEGARVVSSDSKCAYNTAGHSTTPTSSRSCNVRLSKSTAKINLSVCYPEKNESKSLLESNEKMILSDIKACNENSLRNASKTSVKSSSSSHSLENEIKMECKYPLESDNKHNDVSVPICLKIDASASAATVSGCQYPASSSLLNTDKSTSNSEISDVRRNSGPSQIKDLNSELKRTADELGDATLKVKAEEVFNEAEIEDDANGLPDNEDAGIAYFDPAEEVGLENETNDNDFDEETWAECEDGSDEEVCTCQSEHSSFNRSTLEENDDLPSKDVDLSSYIQMVSISEDILLQENAMSPESTGIRKRKLKESNRLVDGDSPRGECSSGRKRIALDCSLTPRSSHTALMSGSSTPFGRRTPRSLIPTRDNPPPQLLEWLAQFQKWSHVERLIAVDRLIDHCEPSQVRHMMKVIEPQFQRDFISLLPRELALQVLSYLDPTDLLRAAQTCRSWRFLCDDNLLWKEKCRKAQIVTESRTDKPKRGRAGNMPPIASPWKAAYMRQHIIEMNWRSRPIRDPKVLKGHDDHVITCLQFFGNRIVSGSDDNTLKVWSAVTGRCLRTLVGHTGGVWSSQMSGNTIISGSTDRTLKVWDLETGQCVHTLLGHTSTVRCMHLHGKKVVSGSRDATLRVWDIESGACLHVLVGHLAAVRCVQYDGKLIVSGAYDYMVKIWHPERQECLHTLQGHTNRVYSLQFDGIHVVSGSLDTSIRVWEAETGNCKHTLMGHQSLTSGMELRQNILVSGNADSTVKVWDITSGQCLQTLSGPNKHQSAVTCLQFNSRFVITSSDDGTVKLWDVKTGEFIRNLVALDSGGSGGVVWRIRANDTKLICAVGSRNGTEETKLMVLDFDVEGACVKCS